MYHLRLFNAELTAYVSAAAILCRARIEREPTGGGGPYPVTINTLGTGLSVAFFPVIFFFSGLYYTDVISTLSVLIAYVIQLGRLDGKDSPSFLNGLVFIAWGVVTLFMRQTNVFWVVVYMGGLEVVHHVKSLRPAKVETPALSTLAEQLKFYAWRYSVGDIHDPPLNMAAPVGKCWHPCEPIALHSHRANISSEDLALCVISVAIAIVCNLKAVLFRYGGLPHLVVLALFAGFVVVNGGVVLGMVL